MTPDILLSRRLHIRGHNGKIYPYLVVNDSGLADARREERVLQLLRMLNHLLGKHKETSRRFLNMTVARVVAVSPQMRLVQVCSCQGTLTWKITLKSIFRTTRHQHPCWPFTKDVVLKGPQTNKTTTSLLQGDNKHLCVHQLIKYLVLQKRKGMAMIHMFQLFRYYEKLSSVQARGSQASHQVLREVLKEVQSSMVPR